MDFTNWVKNGPSVYHKGKAEDCVEILYTGEWNDLYCEKRKSFLLHIQSIWILLFKRPVITNLNECLIVATGSEKATIHGRNV
jgi:hypothetical protein